MSIIVVCTVGYALVLAMFRGKPHGGPGFSLALSIGLGFGFLVECSLLLLAFDRKIDFRFMYGAFVVGIAGIAYAKRNISLSALRASFRETLLKSSLRGRSPLTKAIMIVAVAAICVVTLLVCFNLLALPMYQFDSRAIWGMKAKILFHEHTIFSEIVSDETGLYPIPRHPLFMPIASAWVHESMGAFDDRHVRVLFLTFFVGLMLGMYRLHRMQTGPAGALAFLAALLFVPYLYSMRAAGASSGYVDFTLAFYFMMAATAMLLAMRHESLSFAVAAALFAGCAGLVKNEGLVFSMNLFLATAVCFCFGGRAARKGAEGRNASDWMSRNRSGLLSLATYLIVVALALLPWLLIYSRIPFFPEKDYFTYLNYGDIVSGMKRLPTIARVFGAECLSLKNWSIVWLLVGVSLFGIRRTWTRESLFLFSVIALQLMSYAGIFMITPFGYEIQMKDSVSRLLLHVLPLGVALLAFQVRREEEDIGG